MPETCRNVVDNGSIPPPLFSRNITDTIRHRHRAERGLTFNEAKQKEMTDKYHFRLPNPLSTLKVLLDIESAILLVATGLGIGCFYAIRYVIPSLNTDWYLLLNQARVPLWLLQRTTASIKSKSALCLSQSEAEVLSLH